MLTRMIVKVVSEMRRLERHRADERFFSGTLAIFR